ncbi:hypothetical protein BDSB_21515 [Burkholderia dolosa PC543]|nr:hypothetical protein BDSB_21515 [Burkholderia dolosa PC543]
MTTRSEARVRVTRCASSTRVTCTSHTHTHIERAHFDDAPAAAVANSRSHA